VPTLAASAVIVNVAVPVFPTPTVPKLADWVEGVNAALAVAISTKNKLKHKRTNFFMDNPPHPIYPSYFEYSKVGTI
jgi:hypothetical protein